MDQKFLELLEQIRNTLEEIKEMLTDPVGHLERQIELRNIHAEVRDLQEDADE